MEYRISAEHNIYPNITVEEGYYEETPATIERYKITANSGYVFYDTTENRTELDPETDEEVPVTYYFRLAYLVPNFNFANFPFVAVPESEVDENYIFGGGDNDHEVMSNEDKTVTE